MAMTHIQLGLSSTHGPILRGMLSSFENGYRGLVVMLATIQTMITGDGSDPSQFSEVTTRFGFTSDIQSKAAWDELNSLMAKLTTDTDVTFVKTAIEQALAKFR
jgi:hypothetical protein